jgi:hypothetical protein
MAGGKGILAVARTNCESIAALPLLVRPIKNGREDVASPYGYPGLCQRPDIDHETLAVAFCSICRELGACGYVSCFVRGNPLCEPICDLGIGRVVHHGSTVSIDLNKSRETRSAELASGHRYEIRRTAAAGVTVRSAEAWDWGAFRELYEGAMQRLGAQATYYWPDRHWTQLQHLAEVGEATLLMASGTNGPIAGAMFLHMPRHSVVHYHLAAASRADPKLQPGKLVLWEAEQHFHRLGYSRIHLGGGLGTATDSLFQFKAGFSPDRHAFFTRRIILDESAYRALSGSLQTDFFPAYRAQVC